MQDRKGQPALAINFDDKTTQLFKEVSLPGGWFVWLKALVMAPCFAVLSSALSSTYGRRCRVRIVCFSVRKS